MAALVISSGIAALAIGSGWTILVGPAAVSAAIVSAALWWVLVADGSRVPALKGGLMGAAVGVLAHFPMWLFALLLIRILKWRGSMGESTLSPGESLLAAPVFALVSLFLVGWISAPAGAATGVLLSRLGPKGEGH